ncbi:Zinc finger CCCH domain-containing protein 3, partial [Larimichthys crocea]
MQHRTFHRQTQEVQKKSESSHEVLPGKKVSAPSEVSSSVKANSSTSLQSKPSLTSKTSTEIKQTVNTTTPVILTAGNTGPSLSAASKVLKQASINPTSHTSQGQVSASFPKKSKFTWVKSQNVGGVEPTQASSMSSPTGKAVAVAPASVSKTGGATGSSPSFAANKRTPAKKLPRKLSPVTVAPKTSKYKWVSSSAGAQAKISRKLLSPKALTLSQRALEKGEATKKLKAASAPSAKIKKGTAGSPNSSSLSSRYRWKAGGIKRIPLINALAASLSSTGIEHDTVDVIINVAAKVSAAGSKEGKVFCEQKATKYWTAVDEEEKKVVYLKPAGLQKDQRGWNGTILSPCPHQISTQADKRLNCSSSLRHSRFSPLTFNPWTLLFHLGPASFSHRSPTSQRVFRTPYKMVTRPGCTTAHTLHYNPALSWRAKRIQSARSFLQSRMRAPHDRHPPSTQHWRGSSMCWIRGSLYRVSANKLSRTVGSNMSINRTGRSFSTGHVSSMSPAFNRTSSTRHLASRAVQRSLAIIRHARQKKQLKQYCMYYNRFGKCNRGNSCPYIHDPDKVAVCTRFLRGTCKQADGTCPFSHKVAKEKMPVCSYFLKGICNNSDCPYSHVYVSRKAECVWVFFRDSRIAGLWSSALNHTRQTSQSLIVSIHRLSYAAVDVEVALLKHRITKTKQHINVRRNTLLCVQTSLRRDPALEEPAASCSTANEPNEAPATLPPPPQPRDPEPRSPPRGPNFLSSSRKNSQAAPGTPTKGSLALPSFISLSSSPEEADAPDTRLAETSRVK